MAKKSPEPTPPDDSKRKIEAADRMWAYFAGMDADLEQIRQIKARIRQRNIKFKAYRKGLNEDFPLFDGKDV